MRTLAILVQVKPPSLAEVEGRSVSPGYGRSPAAVNQLPSHQGSPTSAEANLPFNPRHSRPTPLHVTAGNMCPSQMLLRRSSVDAYLLSPPPNTTAYCSDLALKKIGSQTTLGPQSKKRLELTAVTTLRCEPEVRHTPHHSLLPYTWPPRLITVFHVGLWPRALALCAPDLPSSL